MGPKNRRDYQERIDGLYFEKGRKVDESGIYTVGRRLKAVAGGCSEYSKKTESKVFIQERHRLPLLYFSCSDTPRVHS